MSYTLIRSHRRKKTFSIQVRGDGTVIIQVPFQASEADIDRFVKEKKQWLLRTIDRQRQRNHDRRAPAFIPGERLDYLGGSYPLILRERDDPGDALTFNGCQFLLKAGALGAARILFHLWYQKQARTHFEERVLHFSALLGTAPEGIAVNNARSRWGSCSPDNRLAFTWRLIMAPPGIIDYVVVHELCHMKIRNHSRDYWRLVEQILPDHKRRRAWLKDHGHLLTTS